MKRSLLFLIPFFNAYGAFYGSSPEPIADQTKNKAEGLSLDIGGLYTWMDYTNTPSYSGSAGGVQGKLTYQVPKQYFGQARSVYNLGTLTSSLNEANESEWYSEFVGGYCFSALRNWTITPYVGLGMDFIHDSHTAYANIAPVGLRYNIFYALIGFDTHYTWENWMLGLQLDCLPTYNQYLRVHGESGAAWTLDNSPGVAVRIPVAVRMKNTYWLELTPYYRYLPIGASSALGLPSRHLNEAGFFLTFRFFFERGSAKSG